MDKNSSKISKFLAIIFLLMVTSIQILGAVVTPAVGTKIDNQATLHYKTIENTDRTILSNIVTTNVTQIYAVQLTPNRTKYSISGGEAYFTHTLTNKGNGTDSFTLKDNYPDSGYTVEYYIDSNGDGVLSESETLPLTGTGPGDRGTISNLSSGSSVSLIIKVKNAAATVGQTTYNITATSVGLNTVTSVATETLIIADAVVIDVFKSVSPASNDSTVEREITMYLKPYSQPADYDGKNFKLEDTLDSRFSYVTGSAKWKGFNGNTIDLTDDNDSDESSGLRYSYDTSTKTVRFELDVVPKGQSLTTQNGYLEFKVKVAAKTLASQIYNKAKFEYNNGLPNDSTTYTGEYSNDVIYEVLKYVDAEFTGETKAASEQGQEVVFTNTFKNNSNAPESYKITIEQNTFPTGTTFKLGIKRKERPSPADAELDLGSLTTSSSGYSTGMIEVGETVDIILRAQLPGQASGNNYQVTKRATSENINTLISYTAIDKLSLITKATVDLTNDKSLSEDSNAPGAGVGPESSPVTTITITPGSTNTFTLYVNNKNQYIADSYMMEVSSTNNFTTKTLPEGVSIVFKDAGGTDLTGASTGTILAGGNFKVIAHVSVGIDVPADSYNLYFRAKSSTTNSEDIKLDRFIVSARRGIEITPNNTGVIYIGGKSTYTHIIKNTGNVKEGDGTKSVLTLSTNDTLSNWTSSVYLDSDNDGALTGSDAALTNLSAIGGINPKQEIRVFVQIQSPNNAQAGDINTTTLSGDLTQGIYSTAPTVTSATDTTTVKADTLKIEKFQSTDGSNWVKTDINAAPGQKIYYKVEVTNVGGATVQNVVIEDTTPAYTTIIATGNAGVTGLPSYTKNNGGTFTVASYPTLVSGGKGAVQANIGTMSSGDRAILYFGVTIDKAN